MDNDFGLIVCCAVRYGLGRRTYITSFISDYIVKHIKEIDTLSLGNIKESIQKQRENFLYDKPLGDSCDVEAWEKAEQAVMKELEERSKE